MTPTRSPKAFVCLECCFKLLSSRTPHSPLTRSLLPQPIRPFATTSISSSRSGHSNRFQSQKNRNSSENKNDKNQRVRTRSWRTLLKNKTLGKDSSVIVLRDSENKYDRQINEDEDNEDNERREPSKDGVVVVSPEDIVLSMKNQGNLPGQDEVNRNIDSRVPRGRPSEQAGVTNILSKSNFEEIISSLANDFNSTQLSRYINTKAGNAITDELSHTTSDNNLKRSTWRPVNKAPRFKGKRALADVILRDTWKIEIREEVEALGTMELNIKPQQLMLLLSGGQDSPLRNIGHTHKARIDAMKSRNTLRITANKYQCQRAADSIEDLIANLYEIEFDLTPFTVFYKNGVNALLKMVDINGIAIYTNADVEIQHKKKKLLIRSNSQTNAERCQRAIISAINLPSRDHSNLICNKDDASTGLMWPQQDLTPSNHRQIPLHRFIIPRRLSQVDTNPSRLRLSNEGPVVSEETKQIIQDLFNDNEKENISNSVSGNEGMSVIYSADVGNILHQDWKGKIKTHVSEFYDTSAWTFRPGVIGSPTLLQRGYDGYHQLDNEDTFRIHLIPSPFGNHGVQSSTIYPSLDLILLLDKETRAFSVKSFHANLDSFTVSIMMPYLANDVRFSRQTHMDMSNSLLDPLEMKPFLSTMLKSASGHSKLIPPASLKISIPEEAIRTGSNVSPNEQVEYYVESVAFSQELKFEFYGIDLTYRISSFAETEANEEKLFLTPRAQRNHPDMASLGNAMDELLRLLNRNMGRMTRLLDATVSSPMLRNVEEDTMVQDTAKQTAAVAAAG